MDFNNLPAPLPEDAVVAPSPEQQPIATGLDTAQLPPPEAEPSTLADVGQGLVHGAESAVVQAREGVRALGRQILPDSLTQDMQTTLAPHSAAPETAAGKVVADFTRFGLGLLLGKGVVKGASVGATMAQSAIGTAVVSDPHAERLADILDKHTFLSGPVTEYLSADPNDSTLEGKFKAGLEDVLTGAAVGLTFKAVKQFKAMATGMDSPLSTTKADLSSELNNMGKPSTAAPVVDEVVKAERARSAVSVPYAPLKLSDADALTFKTHLDNLIQTDTITDVAKSDMVNLTKMDSPAETLNTIAELSKIVKPRMIEAGWTEHQSQIVTKELADQIGTDPEMLLAGLTSLGKTADEIPPMLMAGRMAIQGLAADAFTLSKKNLLTGEGRDEALKAAQKLAEVLSSFKNLQTGVARSLAGMRLQVGQVDPGDLRKLMDSKSGDDLLKMLAMSEGDPSTVAKLAQAASASVGSKVLAAHNEIWINGLLSGPPTHVVNTISTAMNNLLQPLSIVAGGTIRRDWADVREGIALWKGLGTHLFDSFTMARKAFSIDNNILGGAKPVEQLPAISSINYSLDPDSVVGQAVDYLGKLIRLPSRFLGAEDEFFKQMAYRSKVSAQAAREAADMLKAGKLAVTDTDNYIADRMKSAFDQQTLAALDKEGLEYAEKGTFTQSLKSETWSGNSTFGQDLASLVNNHPVLRGTVMPFVRVPLNLMKTVVEYTPVAGQLRKQFHADIQAGGTRASEAIGKLSLGSMFWTGAAMLAADDHITGSGPVDPELKQALLATGWQPYSIRVNGTYVAYNRLDPFASFLGLAADFSNINGYLSDKQKGDYAQLATLSLVNNLASKSYLKGLIDTLSIVGSNDPHKIDRWLRQRAASYVPSMIGKLNPDPEMKEIRGVMDALMAKIPGYSMQVEAKRDFFGEKRLMPGSFPWSAFNPFPSTEDKNDPVRSEMSRLALSQAHAQFSSPSSTIGNVDLLKGRNANGQTAYDRWLELIGTVTDASGRTMHSAMKDRIASESYKNGSDGDSWYTAGSRVSMLRDVHDQFKTRALRQVKQEFPQLAEALLGDKQNRQAVKKGRETQNPIESILSLNQ